MTPDPRITTLEVREALYALKRAGAKVTADRKTSAAVVQLPAGCKAPAALKAAALLTDPEHRLAAVDVLCGKKLPDMDPILAAVVRSHLHPEDYPGTPAAYAFAATQIKTVQAAGGRVGMNSCTNGPDIKIPAGCKDKTVLAAAAWLRENWCKSAPANQAPVRRAVRTAG